MSDDTNREFNTTQPVVGESADAPHSCGRVVDRRSFLRDASVAIGAALVAGGFIPSRAWADGIREITALPNTSGVKERAYALPAADGVWVDADNRLALVRVDRQVFAFSLECPHKGRMLEWVDAENRFYCSKHKARFSADGRHASGRRTPDLDRYALRQQRARVVVAVDQVFAIDTAPTEWAAAVLRV